MLTLFIYIFTGYRHLLSATIDSAASSFLSARTICSIHRPSDNVKVKYNKSSIIKKGYWIPAALLVKYNILFPCSNDSLFRGRSILKLVSTNLC